MLVFSSIGILVIYFIGIRATERALTQQGEHYEIIDYLKVFQEGKEKAVELRVFLEIRKSILSNGLINNFSTI